MKIGVYGGAFDPIHLEHMKIIEKTYAELNLDKIILLLSYSPPHKINKFSPFHIRARMLQSQVENLEYVIVDQREYHKGIEYNYAYKILAQLVNEYQDDKLIYIIGGDSMVKFHTWVHPEIIAKTLPIAVVARQGYEKIELSIQHARKKYGADIRLLSFVGDNVSSSIIRATYEFGDISDFVSTKVNKIIRQEKLYNHYQFHINKLKASVSDKLFQHSKSTVLYALKLADKLDLNYEEVFLATLLHDCAKEKPYTNQNEYKDYPPKIIHQFVGATVAQKEYGINNPKILDAIRYHTTGRKKMTLLEKLVFCADMLEPFRQFDNVDNIRNLIEKDFDAGFNACVEASINRLMATQREVFYLTRECYDYYVKPK